MNRLSNLLFSLGVLVPALSSFLSLNGCAAETAQGSPATSASAPVISFDAQVKTGGEAYRAKCASCHGAAGEGGRAPRLVGLKEGALPLEPRAGSKRTTNFVTVADVAAFVVEAMPGDAPGTLKADEAWAILAFDLSANGIKLEEPLGPELAKTLTIPR